MDLEGTNRSVREEMPVQQSSAGEYTAPDGTTLAELRDAANRMRVASIKATTAAKSGHPTSCASAADIVSALFFHAMNHSLKEPRDPNSDRFVMSKGHAAPLLYAAWAEAGHIAPEELLKLRQFGHSLEGHPTPRLDFVDVATGSLGQGLSAAAGMAYGGKYFDKASYRVYCLLGDGEAAEGSVWEAAAFASEYGLDNLIAIIDCNRLGQSRDTALGHRTDVYKARLEAFGWHTIVIDGHDMGAICGALFTAKSGRGGGKPIAIVAKTFKGQGIEGQADLVGFHGKPIPADAAPAICEAILARCNNKTGPIKVCASEAKKDAPTMAVATGKLSNPPAYSVGEKVATRAAYGTALVKLGEANNRVVALDAEVSNSTFSDKFRKTFPDRYVECFIAEQNMVGVAVGLASRGRTIPFASTFATFFTRAFDQLRMGAISSANIKLVGSHVGVSIGEDGPSQMGLEDIAMFRTLPGAVVLYPSDAVATERAVELAAQTTGIVFIRTGRPANPVLYANDTEFAVGKGRSLRSGTAALVVAAGVTLHEAVKASDELAEAGLEVALYDPFSIKPMDEATVAELAGKAGGRVVVVEDHYPEGGIGDAVRQALDSAPGLQLRMKHLAVREIPRSGPADKLLDAFGISARHIVQAVKDLQA